MSSSTLPGPTDGSWKTSPTIMSIEVMGIAFSRWNIKYVSTIEASSMITASASRGLSRFLSKRLSLKLYPSSLCMVFAFLCVNSASRLAARPVGAARLICFPRALNTALIDLIRVVFPVPGPPVMITARWENIFSRTLSCSCESFMASFFRTSFDICSVSIPWGTTGTDKRALSLFARPASAWWRAFK